MLEANKNNVPANSYTFSAYQVELRPMAQSHQSLIRTWRNQDEIREQMLDSELISEAQQQKWFEKTQFNTQQLHWIISFRGQFIGVTNVKSLLECKTAAESELLEPGLYIGERRFQGNIVAFAPTLAMYDFCFEQLAAQKFRAIVKRSNQNAMKYNQTLGYQVVEHGSLCVMELERDNYLHASAPLRQFLSRRRK